MVECRMAVTCTISIFFSCKVVWIDVYVLGVIRTFSEFVTAQLIGLVT
jgi:hypothetical protein